MLLCVRDCLRRNVTHNIGFSGGIRMISSSEIAAALRPFYFVVHPDLFGRHPEQRSVNEESLKHLSAYLESLQQRRLAHSVPKTLNFYIRDSETERRDTFKLVKISLGRDNDTKIVIKRILESCNLSTDYVDKIKELSSADTRTGGKFYDATDFSTGSPFDIEFNKDFVEFERKYYAQKKKEQKTLKIFLENNVDLAHGRSKDLEGLKEDVFKLQENLKERLKLSDMRYECGWNFEHYRGCLKTLERLVDLQGQHMKALKGRILVFAPFTGVSLEGHIMLFTGDVLNNWIDFIKNIPKHDVYLQRIPAYEIALSQVLRNIKIGRRKFMPKAQALSYAGHLTKVTTSLLDFLSTQKYPKTWPESLSEFEIVVESEAGPLMVSPTGQLITPATCPGSILVDFLTTNFDEAKNKAKHYNTIKHIEKELFERCLEVFCLGSLKKDDSVTPEKMIASLEKLLALDVKDLNGVHLNISTYYSVLSDGTICIPWDWKLE